MNMSMMQGPIPNVIALPYRKHPPMHIHARSWRQLLKLMAKLSGTQIEPSVEAMAVTKGELKLRTVVQFFKVRSSRSSMRILLRAARFTTLQPTGGRSYISPLTIPHRLIIVIRTGT